MSGGSIHKATMEALEKLEQAEEPLAPDQPAEPLAEEQPEGAVAGEEPKPAEEAEPQGGEGEETKSEEAVEAGEAGEEGAEEAEEKPLFEIPDEGEFEIPVEGGKLKRYSGLALKNMVNQSRDLDKKNAALKEERAKWEAEREDWKKNTSTEIEQRIVTDTNRRLVEWGVFVHGSDGKLTVNPRLTQAEADEAAGAARAEATREEIRKLPRLSEEDLGEEAPFTSPRVLEVLNSQAELIEQLLGRVTKTDETLAAEKVAKERHEAEQRAQALYKEINEAVASSRFAGDDILSEMAANAVIDALHKGYQGRAADFVADLEKRLRPMSADGGGDAGEGAEEPTAAEGERKRVAPPRRSAPPAVGSTGGRMGREARAPKRGPSFGGEDSKKYIEEQIAERLHGG